MKKFFTLVACALCAAGMNAQSVVQVSIEKDVLNVSDEDKVESCSAEVVLSDNDCFTATTVYASTAGSGDYIYKDGLTFANWIQLRVTADPSEDAPTGTENSGSTPVVIVAKQDATLNVYLRTGGNKTCNLFDQSTFTAVEGTSDSEVDATSESNSFWIWTWTIEAGKTYVLTERGGTGRLSGFSYAIAGGASSIDGVALDVVNPNAPAYNLAGQRVNSAFKGVVVKDGKKLLQR